MNTLFALAFGIPLLGSPVTDVGVGAEAQVSAGRLPINAVDSPEAALETVAIVLSGLRLRSRRSEFIFRYRPRAYYRVPNSLDLDRPLLLNDLGVQYQTAPDALSTFTFRARTRFGEMGYNDLQKILDQGTGTVESSIIPIALGDLNVDYGRLLAPTHKLVVGLHAGLQAPYGAAPDATNSIVRSYQGDVQLGYEHTLGSIDTIGANAFVAVFESDLDGLALGPRLDLFWQRDLSEKSSFGVTAGAAYIRYPNTGDDSIIPTGKIDHQSNWRVRNQVWSSELSAGIRGFFDRISAVYLPQAFTSWRFLGTFSRDWSTGFALFSSASLTREPIAQERYETYAGLRLPSTYRFNRNLEAQFAFSASVRGPHLTNFESGAFQEELSGTISLRYAIDTSGSGGAWLK